MKKLFILGLSLFLFSCQKENIEPQNEIETPIENCSCGRIVHIGDPFIVPNNGIRYDIKVRNNCSNNVWTYTIHPSGVYIGDEWCHPTGNTW